MALLGTLKTLPPTTTKHGVPLLFHDSHVETGFRHPHQPWMYYIFSFFQIHNECINCWTHFLALVVTLVRVGWFWTEFDLLGDPYMWPLSAGLLTMVILFICSTCAHCFHNKSELVHYTCFMIDNAGIGLSGLGAGLIHHTYCFHDSLPDMTLGYASIAVGSLLSLLVTVCCSISKTRYSPPYPTARRVWQIGSVGAVYSWLISPILQRAFLCVANREPWDEGMFHHFQAVLWFFSAGFFFGSDIPQRLFSPGKFDFIGHGHQLFHVCIMMASYKLLDGAYVDILRMKSLGRFDQLPPPTFTGTFGSVLFVILINVVLVAVFRAVAILKIQREGNTCGTIQNGVCKGS